MYRRRDTDKHTHLNAKELTNQKGKALTNQKVNPKGK